MTKESGTLTIAEIQKRSMQVAGGLSLSEMCSNLERKYLNGQVNSQKPNEKKP